MRALDQSPLSRCGESIKREEHPHEGATGWIQWKGTSVCMDVNCPCGYHGHLDEEFAYYYRCRGCSTLYEVGATVALYPIDPGAPGMDKVSPGCIKESADDLVPS